MRLTVLNSSSVGNCFILKANNGDVLILEAGISLQKVKEVLNFKIQGIKGLIATHRHLDHFKYANDYAKAGIPCYSNKEAIDSVPAHHNLISVDPLKKYKVGDFEIFPFNLIHDVPIFGYFINHPESGLICFITDSFYSPYTFDNVNHWLIEANYDEDIINEKILHGEDIEKFRRTTKSHMSINTCIKTLLAYDLTPCRNIVLLHLSEGNSNSRDFRQRTISATGKQVYIADKGLSINLDREGF